MSNNKTKSLSDFVVLEAAIRQAIAGGWKMVTPDDSTRTREEDPVKDVVVYWDLDRREGPDAYYHIIFNHDFARALWSKGTVFKHKDGGLVTIENPNYWKAKLRSMVVAKDPIKYLSEHINPPPNATLSNLEGR